MAGRKIWIGNITINGKLVKQIKSSDKDTVCFVMDSELYSRYGIKTMFSVKNNEPYTWKSNNLKDDVKLEIN